MFSLLDIHHDDFVFQFCQASREISSDPDFFPQHISYRSNCVAYGRFPLLWFYIPGVILTLFHWIH